MLITPAWAQAAGGSQGGGIESLVLIVLMFGVLYFLMAQALGIEEAALKRVLRVLRR